MSTTSTERMRERRRRRARREVQLTIVLHEDDLAEIAKRGYEEAACTDPKIQAEAVSLFASDSRPRSAEFGLVDPLDGDSTR